jgi:uncharacterized membrane-anchored protein YhcB (DUF1043 family)
MNKIGLIAGIITTIMLIYLAYSSTVRVFEAQEELKTSEEQLAEAKAEYAQGQQELADILAGSS